MRHFRVIKLVYIKNPVLQYPGQWAGRMSEMLSEVLSEPKTWCEAYEEYRRHIWVTKRQGIRMPKDMAMEIILHGYTTRHGRRTNPFSMDSMLNDHIVKEREWLVMNGVNNV